MLLQSSCQFYQLLQIFYVYITAYYALRCIDKNIANNVHNFSFRISLSLICSVWIYSTFPDSLTRLDYSIIGHCAFTFFSILKLNILMLYNDKMTRQKQTFSEFIFYFLWLIYPINKEKDIALHLKVSLRNIIRVIITDLIPSFALCMAAFFLWIYLQNYMDLCLNNKQKVNMIVAHYWCFTWYCLVNVFQILSGFCFMSVMFQSLVRVITLHRYKYISFNTYPLFSVSVKEIWSKRYNYFVRSILHENVFKPLMDSGYSSAFAAFMAFFVSGLLHVYISWKHMGNGLITTQWFFVLHGIITICEKYIYGNRKRNELSTAEFLVRVCITNAIFTMTLPFYVGLMVREYPDIGLLLRETQGAVFDDEKTVALMAYLPKMQCVYP